MVLNSLVALVVRGRPASISLQLPRSKKKIWTDWMASIERSLVLGRWEPSSNQKGQKWDVFENRSKSRPQYKSTGKWEIQSLKPRPNTLSPISTRQNSVRSDVLVISLVWSCLYTLCQWLLISSFRPLQSNVVFHHLN